MKKRKTLTLATLLTILLLTACGTTEKIYDTPDEVFTCYQNLEDKDNLHQDVSLQVRVSITGGMSFDMPSSMETHIDSFDNATSKGTYNAASIFFGEEFSSDMDFYTEPGKNGQLAFYQKPEGEDWNVIELSPDVLSDQIRQVSTFTALTEEALADAKMDYDSSEKIYRIRIPFSDVSENILPSDTAGMLSVMGLDELLADFYADTEVMYAFDKKGYLTTITLEPSHFETVLETEDGKEAVLSVDLSMETSCTDYGSIRETDAAVPEEIKENAAPAAGFSAAG